MRKAAPFFAIGVGIAMISVWTMLYLSGEIPELQSEPARIIMHLLAEMLTAVFLIAAGLALLTGQRWGRSLYLLANGALLYTLIQSPGYYLQKGDFAFVAMFSFLFVLTIILLAGQLSSTRREES